MDTYINVKVYVKSSDKANKLFDKVDKIYTKYQKLTDVYDDNSDISLINNNKSNDEYLKIDKDLYNMIELALSYKDISNNKFNINMGNTIKVWKKCRDNKNGIPTKKELNNSINNNDIVLKDNMILNNHPSIDLGAVSKGYATKEVGEMLDDNKVFNYIINAGGNVLVGKAYKKDKFSIGIESPTNNNDVYTVVKGNNISVVTSGGYERFYEYEGIKYHHIIDPDTLYPANNCLSVTVVTKDSAKADILSTTLFLLPVDEALELVNKLDDVEAIFYVNDNKIIKSKGFNKYE